MSGFRDFTSRDFSCAFQTTKRRAPSCWSNGCRAFAQDLTVGMLSAFPCSPRPFWTGFPLWIRSQDESYGLNGCSLHMRCILCCIWRNFLLRKKNLWIFQRFERISQVLWSLLQSLIDLSDFWNSLNAFSFYNYLSRIWTNALNSSRVPAFCNSSSWIFDDSLKIEQESLLFLPSQSLLPSRVSSPWNFRA